MTRTWKIVTGATLGLALIGGSGAAIVSAREQGPAGPMGQGRMGRRGPGGPGGPGGIVPGLRALNLTDTQREQVAAVMDGHKAEFEAQIQKAAAARRALRDVVAAETFDEGAVRQKSADLAQVEADGAVLRARVHSEVWALLTPEQRQKARELRAQADQRFSRGRERGEPRRNQRAERRRGV
jgi:protein CpxP